MIYIVSETAYVPFVTNSATGAATNADSTPTAVLVRNGVVDNAVTVTVTNLSTGAYIASFAVPSGYAAGDELVVLVSATIATIAAKSPIGHGKVDVLGASLATAITNLPQDADITAVLEQATTAATQASTAATQATTAATQATTAATQASTAAAQSSAANGKLTSAFTNMVTRWNTMVEQIGSSGLYRFLSGALSQAPTASVSGAPVQLVQGPYELVLDEAGPDSVLQVRRGDIVTQRLSLKSAAGVPINLAGVTLTAKIVGLDETDLVTGLDTEVLLADEGRASVVIDATELALANVRRARLIVTRTAGATDISSYPAPLLFEG